MKGCKQVLTSVVTRERRRGGVPPKDTRVPPVHTLPQEYAPKCGRGRRVRQESDRKISRA